MIAVVLVVLVVVLVAAYLGPMTRCARERGALVDRTELQALYRRQPRRPVRR